MAAPQHSRILRVGLLQDGRILEERHLRKPGDFTIGQDAKNSLVLPLPDLPARFPVFEYRAGQYSLVFTEDMKGRVHLGSSDVDFQALRSRGMVTERGIDQFVLPLQESARGVVELDADLRLFFQFIPAPVETEKPRLPPDLRGGSWRTMDRMFFGVLAASLLIHFSGAAIIIGSKPPPEPELELAQLDDRFIKVMMPPKLEEPKKPTQETAQAAATEDKKPKASDEDKKPAESAGKPSTPEQAAVHRAEVAKKVQGTGLLKILGAGGKGGGGAFEDVLGSGTGGQDVAAALSGATGVGVQNQASIGSTGPRGSGTGSVAGIGSLGTSGGGKVDLGTKKEAEVSGNVASGTPEVDSADVDRTKLAAFIKARLKAIQGCYEKELKRNPSLKGKVLVRFTIKSTGRVGDLDIEENTLGNDAVASCIRTVIRAWVFPFKPDDDVPVAYPFVFSPAG